MINIHCKFDKMILVTDLKDHPLNRNKHGSDQIERLAELYKFQGIRHPIIVSKKSGFIVAGHGRKLAAIRAGLKEMPVVYQDFESDAQEYAFIQSDNAIALWADLDIENIKIDALEFDIDFKMFGLKDFKVPEQKEIENKSTELNESDFQSFEHQCPKCGFEWSGSTNE